MYRMIHQPHLRCVYRELQLSFISLLSLSLTYVGNILVRRYRPLTPCCAPHFIFTYPAVPLFFYALTLLCLYFSTHLIFYALTLLCPFIFCALTLLRSYFILRLTYFIGEVTTQAKSDDPKSHQNPQNPQRSISA